MLILLAGTVAAVLGYNVATTKQALLFGHQAYLADHDLATQFRPASGAVLAQAILEWEKVAVPIWIAAAAAVFLLARPQSLSRGVMMVGLLAAAAPWMAYSFRPPPTEIHYGPRYELVSLPIAAAFIGIALARIRSLPVFVLAALLPIAWQVTVTGRHVRDLSITVYRGEGLERTRRALGEAIAPERAVLVATGPAGSLPAIDLARNQDIDASVLVGAGFLRNRVERAQHRKTYVWDGLPGLPMVWSVAALDDVAHVIATDPVTVGRRDPSGPTSGWLVTWNRTSCAAADSRRPPRGASVSMPGTRPEIDSAFGPCPGEASGVGTSADGTFATSSSTSRSNEGSGPIALQLRAFVIAERPGSYLVKATSNGVLAARQIIIGDHDRLALNGDLASTPASIAMNVTGEGVATFIGVAAYRLEGDVDITVSLPPGLRAYSRMPGP